MQIKSSHNHFLILLVALEMTLVCNFAYRAGILLSSTIGHSDGLVSAMWCMISAILVLQNSMHDSWVVGINRIIATCLGGILPLVYLYTVGVNFVSYCLSVLSLVMIILYWMKESYLRVSILTFSIIYVMLQLNGDVTIWIEAFNRIIESAVGIAISVAVRLCAHPLHKIIGSKYS